MKDDNNNWLGFSLSPHMKMVSNTASDPHNHHFSHQSEAPPTSASFYLNSSTVSYDVGENGDFHSTLPVMPLKSDGSLCIMDAFSRSHSQG